MSFLINNRSLAAHDAGGRGGWDHLVAAVKLAMRARASRRALPELPDYLLADIGMDRATALSEAARLPWDTGPVRAPDSLWATLVQRVERARVKEITVSAVPNQVSWGG